MPYRGTDDADAARCAVLAAGARQRQASTSADVTLDNGSGFASGDFVLLAATDCSEGAIFQVSGVTARGRAGRLARDAAGMVRPATPVPISARATSADWR